MRFPTFFSVTCICPRFPSIRAIAMSDAFSGTAVPPGVAADAFYEKGKRPFVLIRLVLAMMRAPRSLVFHPPRSVAPIWIPSNGHNPSGEPFVLISCPECLRAFPAIPDKSPAKMLSTKCAWCSTPIHYAIVHSPDASSPQNLPEADSRQPLRHYEPAGGVSRVDSSPALLSI
jgi:hypothetical protein